MFSWEQNNVTIDGIVLVSLSFCPELGFHLYLFDEPKRAVTKPNYLMKSKWHGICR